MKKIVMKFGGTSVATGDNIRNVAGIVANISKKDGLIVVVSALDGVTDELLEAANQAQKAKQDYIQKFKRVVGLAEQGFDIHTIGFLVKLSPALVEQYYQLYRSLHMVAHRKTELKEFFKKSLSEVN